MTALYGRHAVDCGHLGCWPCARDFRLSAATGPASRRSSPPPVEPTLSPVPGGGTPDPTKET